MLKDYYVLQPHHGPTENKYMVDDLTIPLLFWRSLYSSEPIEESEYSFDATIDKRAKLNDNLLNAPSDHLYSPKFVELLEEFSVAFQKFPVRLHVKGSDTVLNYYLCRLTDRYEFFDPIHSISEIGSYLYKLSEEAVKCQLPMFLDTKFAHVCFVHRDVKNAIRKSQITGCDIMDVPRFIAREESRWSPGS